MLLRADRKFEANLLELEQQGRLLQVLSERLNVASTGFEAKFWEHLTDTRESLFPKVVSFELPRRTYFEVEVDIMQHLWNLVLGLKRISWLEEIHLMKARNTVGMMLDKIMKDLLFSDALLPPDGLQNASHIFWPVARSTCSSLPKSETFVRSYSRLSVKPRPSGNSGLQRRPSQVKGLTSWNQAAAGAESEKDASSTVARPDDLSASCLSWASRRVPHQEEDRVWTHHQALPELNKFDFGFEPSVLNRTVVD
jgi:hypothetical protein